MFKYLRFLCWVVVKELLPALWKAIARRRGQTGRTEGKNRQKEHISRAMMRTGRSSRRFVNKRDKAREDQAAPEAAAATQTGTPKLIPSLRMNRTVWWRRAAAK